MDAKAAATKLVGAAQDALRRVRGRAVPGTDPPPPSPPSLDDATRDPAVVQRYLDEARRAQQRRRSSGDAVVTPADVTVLCVTNRPAQLADVVGNVRRQSPPPVTLLVVCHGAGFDRAAVTDALASIDGARWLAAPGEWTLGACLNFGMERCETRYVAKFDDDDFYGAAYLSDAVRSLQASGAAIGGKHSYFVHLAGRDATVLRFPGREFRATTYLAGGTLLLDLERLGALRFPDRTIGEDQGLIRSCVLRGRGVYAGDMFSYVQRRAQHNTWNADERYLARGALVVGDGERLDLVDVVDVTPRERAVAPGDPSTT